MLSELGRQCSGYSEHDVCERAKMEVVSPSPASTEPLRSDARRNRDAVIDAAIRVLGADPSASMQVIADASGVARSTVYRRFPNRDRLVAELMQHVLREAAEGLEAAERHPGPARDALDGLAAHVIGLGGRYAFLSGVHAPAKAELAPVEDVLSDRMATLVRRWQTAGEVRRDVPAHWPGALLRGLSIAAGEEAERGRLELARAVALAQQALRAATAPPAPGER